MSTNFAFKQIYELVFVAVPVALTGPAYQAGKVIRFTPEIAKATRNCPRRRRLRAAQGSSNGEG